MSVVDTLCHTHFLQRITNHSFLYWFNKNVLQLYKINFVNIQCYIPFYNSVQHIAT